VPCILLTPCSYCLSSWRPPSAPACLPLEKPVAWTPCLASSPDACQRYCDQPLSCDGCSRRMWHWVPPCRLRSEGSQHWAGCPEVWRCLQLKVVVGACPVQVGYSAAVFYGYVGVIGLALWAMMKWWFKSDVSLPQVWCTYGGCTHNTHPACNLSSWLSYFPLPELSCFCKDTRS
jgi:hypothetical protein